MKSERVHRPPHSPSAFRCSYERRIARVDLVERRPRLALELDLDRERPRVAGVAQDLEHAGEVDGAVADRREVPVALAARRVLQVDVREICVIFGRSSTALSPE